jgi:hypothetical protein
VCADGKCWGYKKPIQVSPRIRLEFEDRHPELRAKDLLNSRMAYVSISREAQDAQIFTNNASELGKALGRDVSHALAVAPEALTPKIAPQSVLVEEISMGIGLGLQRQEEKDIPR